MQMKNDVEDLLDGKDRPDAFFTEIETLCVNCLEEKNEENFGATRLLKTQIPFFRDIIVSSFYCPHCHSTNRSVDPAGDIEELGSRIEVKLLTINDLNRRILRSKGAVLCLPQFDSTFPCLEGSISTIEGVLEEVIQNLTASLLTMKNEEDSTTVEKLEAFIEKLHSVQRGEMFPLIVIVEDASGRSQVENFHAPYPDGNMRIEKFMRSIEQDEALGIYKRNEEGEEEKEEKKEDKNGLKFDGTKEKGQSKLDESSVVRERGSDIEKFDPKAEVSSIPVPCPQCGQLCSWNSKLVDIPFFKETIIMSTTCEACGHRDSEAMGGCGIEPLGKRITLHMTNPVEDLKRDLLKSESAALLIPELEFEISSGSLGGKFTTVEGILRCVYDQLSSSNAFLVGDSALPSETSVKMQRFLRQLEEIIAGTTSNVHIVLDDPAGNVYIQNPFAPDPDPNLVVERYQRAFQQNEDMGLNDMQTENYESL